MSRARAWRPPLPCLRCHRFTWCVQRTCRPPPPRWCGLSTTTRCSTYMFPDPRDEGTGPAPFLHPPAPPDLHEEGARLHDRGVPRRPPCGFLLGPVRPRCATLIAQIPKLLVLGRRAGAALRLVQLVESRHPKTPHYYLGGLGTDPPWQGRGFGSAVLAPVLEICDRERVARLSRVLQGEQRRASTAATASRSSTRSRAGSSRPALAHVARAARAELRAGRRLNAGPRHLRWRRAVGRHRGQPLGSPGGVEDDLGQQLEHGPRRGGGRPGRPLHDPDEAPRDLGELDEGETVQQVARHSRRRQDGGPPALEGERGDEAGPVDLGSGEKRRCRSPLMAASRSARNAVPASGQQQGDRPSASLRLISPAAARGWSTGTTRTRSSSKSGVTARSAPSAGRLSTAMSTCPVASWVSSAWSWDLDEDQAQVGVSLGAPRGAAGARASGRSCR